MLKPDGWAEKQDGGFIATDYACLKFEIEAGISPAGSVGILTIQRPEALNALNVQLLDELRYFINHISEQVGLRCLVLTGAGEKAFVAGADIKEMAALTREEALGLAQKGQRIFQELENLKIPTIAMVNGFALGGGLELAMACDFMIAAKSARFGLPEVSLGLLPGYGGTQRLPRFVGKSIARMITLTGDIFSATQGFEWGLFAKVVEAAELRTVTLAIAKTIASRGPIAEAAAKEAIRIGSDLSQGEGFIVEAEMFAKVFASEDHHEGIKAFIEKRPPQFVGK
jgi:enoyl-CoA hydratase